MGENFLCMYVYMYVYVCVSMGGRYTNYQFTSITEEYCFWCWNFQKLCGNLEITILTSLTKIHWRQSSPYQQNMQWYALALVSVAVLLHYYAGNTSCSLSVVLFTLYSQLQWSGPVEYIILQKLLLSYWCKIDYILGLTTYTCKCTIMLSIRKIYIYLQMHMDTKHKYNICFAYCA